MKYLFIFPLVISYCVSGMEKPITTHQQDEQEAIALAHISLRTVGNSSRNDELYRDLLNNAARLHYHTLANFTLDQIKKKRGDRGLPRIINKGFFSAASAGNVTFIQRILAENPSIKDRSRALHLGAKNGNLAVVKLLLENGAHAHYTAKRGWTVLATAIKHDREEVVKFLLDQKVNPNSPAPYNFNDLLSFVVVLNHGLKYLRLLLHYGADPNGSNRSDNLRPLMVASLHNLHAGIGILLTAGANPNLQMPQSKHTALIQAAKHGHVEAVEELLPGSCSRIAKDLIETFHPNQRQDNHLVLLPIELLREVTQFRIIPTDTLLVDKTGKNALEIAQALEKKAVGEKKNRYKKIVELLKPRSPQEVKPHVG
jgi:ankyrin repeat protein